MQVFPTQGRHCFPADTMFSFVVLVRRDMNWTIAFSALEEMLDWLPCRVYRSAGGIGAKFLIVPTKQFCW